MTYQSKSYRAGSSAKRRQIHYLEELITASRLGGARDCATAVLFSEPRG